MPKKEARKNHQVSGKTEIITKCPDTGSNDWNLEKTKCSKKEQEKIAKCLTLGQNIEIWKKKTNVQIGAKKFAKCQTSPRV